MHLMPFRAPTRSTATLHEQTLQRWSLPVSGRLACLNRGRDFCLVSLSTAISDEQNGRSGGPFLGATCGRLTFPFSRDPSKRKVAIDIRVRTAHDAEHEANPSSCSRLVRNAGTVMDPSCSRFCDPYCDTEVACCKGEEDHKTRCRASDFWLVRRKGNSPLGRLLYTAEEQVGRPNPTQAPAYPISDRLTSRNGPDQNFGTPPIEGLPKTEGQLSVTERRWQRL